jgi:hypothetical protein
MHKTISMEFQSLQNNLNKNAFSKKIEQAGISRPGCCGGELGQPIGGLPCWRLAEPVRSCPILIGRRRCGPSAGDLKWAALPLGLAGKERRLT